MAASSLPLDRKLLIVRWSIERAMVKQLDALLDENATYSAVLPTREQTWKCHYELLTKKYEEFLSMLIDTRFMSDSHVENDKFDDYSWRLPKWEAIKTQWEMLVEYRSVPVPVPDGAPACQIL